MADVVPSGSGVRVLRQIGPTELLVDAADPQTVAGSTYAVCRVDPESGAHRPIRSVEDGAPLTARVETDAELGSARARLLAEPPPDADFEDARLCPLRTANELARGPRTASESSVRD